MQCKTENHHNKKIITVCLDKNCQEKRLSCLLCQIQLHNTHLSKLVEIDEINQFIKQESQKQNQYPESSSYGQKYIIQGLENLLVLIDSLQKIIVEKIEAIKQLNLQEYIKKMSKMQQGIEQQNLLFEGILQFVEVKNCLINLKTSKKNELNEMEENQNKIIKESDKNLQMMISLYSKIDTPNIYFGKFCFKENRKNADIVIIEECIIKKTKSSSNAIAFANEGFDPNKESYAFSFIIQNLASCVWVGVGNDDGNNLPSYLYSNFNSLGHGQYMIGSQNINTFHHSDKDINYKQIGFPITAGNKIQIKYDHISKVLEFKKQSESNVVIKMPITDMTKRLYPCAMLGHIDEQVKLVEY